MENIDTTYQDVAFLFNLEQFLEAQRRPWAYRG